MQAVIDTNVIVSATFFNGTPRKIFEKLARGEFELICSQEIIAEYIRVIEDLGKKYDKEIGKLASNFVIENSTLIKVAARGKYSRDPDDDKFINCAMAANARFLVSGDLDLLVLKKINNIEIITPKAFLLKF